MRFTEHELTSAVTGVAKSMLATKRRHRRRGVDIDAVWEEMDRFERFRLLDGIGSQVLPVLVALPDIEVEPGSRASYSAEQVRRTVEEVVDASGVGPVQRLAAVKTRTALVHAALEHLPPRSELDGPITEG